MANKTFTTRIMLKHDTYANWIANDPVLLKGEAAIATIHASTGAVNQEPATIIKFGDGEKKFSELPIVSGLAANVHNWALAATKPVYQASEIQGLDAFIATEIQDTDTQYKIEKVTDYQYKLMSKAKGDAAYTTEVAVIDIPNDTAAIGANTAAITALQGLVGDTAVATQISSSIAALKLAETYDAKGAAATAESNAKTYADGLNTAMDTRVDALEAKFGEGAGTVESQIAAAVAVIQGEVDALETLHDQDKTALEGAIAVAKQAGDNAQADVDALAEKVGTVAEGKTVVGMIEAAQSAAEKVANDNNSAMNTRVAAIEGDYLKAADKTELADDISDNADAITALEGLVGGKAVSEQITAVTDPLTGRVADIEKDYLKAADKTELSGATTAVSNRVTALEGQITGLSGAMHFEGVKAELPADVAGYEAGDVIVVGNKEYVFNEGAFVEFGDVSAEGERITALETHKTAYEGKVATLESEMDAVEGRATELEAAMATKAAQSDLNALSGRMDTAEGDIEALEADVAKKAAQTDLESLAGRVTTAEGKVTTLESEMDAAQADITAIEGLVGEVAVATQIQNAIDALKIGDYAKAADLTAAIGRIATVEGDLNTAGTGLKARMTAAEGEIDGLQETIAKKANDADLAAIAKTGNVNDLIQTTGDVLIFDCGSSAV